MRPYKWHVALLATLAVVSYGNVSQATFTQCPAVGASPGCAVLITINPGGFTSSLSFQQDTTVGPYDGIDDQLVGVVNNSGTIQSSISLSGPNVFGFDGDGAGGTTYAGPNTSFVVVDNNNGTVQFTGGGLPNGQSRWFSLEGTPHIPVVGINKDLQNGTGVAADEIRIVLWGTQNVAFHYDGPNAHLPTQPDITFGSFTTSTSGGATPTTTLDWKTPNAIVQPGYIVHVGFSINSDFADIQSITWYSNGVPVGCAPQVPAHTHSWGDPNSTIEFMNTASNCPTTPSGPAARPLFVGNFMVKWYSFQVSLSQLRPDLLPKPLRTDTISTLPISIAPGNAAQILAPNQGPGGAVSGVLLYDVSGSADFTPPDVTHDVLQFPAFPPTTQCTDSSQCPAGETCQNGVCVAPTSGCTSSSQCAAGQTCTNGICVQPGGVPASPPWAVAMIALVLAGMGVYLARRSLSRNG
jgi:Cys-rich repeat protein